MKEKLEMLLVSSVIALMGGFGLYILFTEGIILDHLGGTYLPPIFDWIACFGFLIGGTYGIYAYWPWRSRPTDD